MAWHKEKEDKVLLSAAGFIGGVIAAYGKGALGRRVGRHVERVYIMELLRVPVDDMDCAVQMQINFVQAGTSIPNSAFPLSLLQNPGGLIL